MNQKLIKSKKKFRQEFDSAKFLLKNVIPRLNGTQTQASSQNYASIENPVECLKEGLRVRRTKIAKLEN